MKKRNLTIAATPVAALGADIGGQPEFTPTAKAVVLATHAVEKPVTKAAK
jgi:hypothetical protein